MSKPQLVHTRLRHIRREIRYLTGLNLKKTKLRHLETRLRVFLGNYLARYEQINAPFVYRVRPNEQVDHYDNVCDLWYPKPEQVKKFGRANYEGKPVFYCSDSCQTAIIEQKINIPGESYSVLKCERINMKEFPIVLEIGVNDITGRLNPRLGGDRPDPRAAVEAFLNTDYEVRRYDLYQQFLINEFTRRINQGDEHLYKVSAVFAEQVLDKDGVDGICFPSVQSRFNGVNVAFTTEAIDRLYRPIECRVVKVTDIIGDPGYRIDVTHRSKAIVGRSKIEW